MSVSEIMMITVCYLDLSALYSHSRVIGDIRRSRGAGPEDISLHTLVVDQRRSSLIVDMMYEINYRNDITAIARVSPLATAIGPSCPERAQLVL